MGGAVSIDRYNLPALLVKQAVARDSAAANKLDNQVPDVSAASCAAEQHARGQRGVSEPGAATEVSKGEAYDAASLGPPTPGCDDERLATMQALNLLDTAPAPELDNILQLVCNIFRTENAVIALFGDKRIYIRNTIGGFQQGDFAWRHSFCGWTMSPEQAQIMVVNDALKDARFQHNKFVREGNVRFYAGTPLVASNGHRLGTLCFADPTPREFDENSAQILNNFAELVTRELERDLVLAMAKAKQQQLVPAEQGYRMLLRSIDCFEESLLLVDTAKDGWPLLHTNTAWCSLTGSSCLQDIGQPLQGLFQDAQGQPMDAAELQMLLQKNPHLVLRDVVCSACSKMRFDLYFAPVNATNVDATFVPISVPTYVAGRALPSTDLPTSYYFVRAAESASCQGRPRDGAGRPGLVQHGRAGTPAGAFRDGARDSAMSMLSINQAAVCQQLHGLELGVPIAAGSYGRVYKGKYQDETVAVKVLDSDAISRRDAATGLSLEVLLAEKLNHPFIVRTLAWTIAHPQAALPPRDTRWGESWNSGVHTLFDCGQQEGEQQQPQRRDDTAAFGGLPHLGATMGGVAPRACVRCSGGCSPMPGLANPLQGSGVTGHHFSKGSGSHCPSSMQLDDEASSSAESSALMDGQTWLVMEYCDRGCLQDAVDRGWLKHPDGSINLLAMVVTAYEIASGMAHLHSLDIVHGDLSAFNVMLTSVDVHAAEAGRGFAVRVADFGLARHLGTQSRVQTTTYGTITHMPPEVLLEGRLSKAADVYAFGVLLWQMLCGCRAWAGMSHAAIVHAVCVEHQQLVFPAGAPDGFVSLAQACMDPDAAARPTFHDVLEVLEPLAAMARVSL